MNALFTTAMALRPLDSDPGNPACRVFEGELNEHWTIGPKVHGGAMVALCANAARTAYGAAGQQPMRQPVAVSASFLWAPDPGTMRLVTSIRKRGRRISVADVELTQGGRTAVHAVVTLGEPEHFLPGVDGSGGASGTAPLLSANPVVELMAPEPPEGVVPIGPGHQLAGLVHLGEGCDVRPVLSTRDRWAATGDSAVGASTRRCSGRAVRSVVRGLVGPGDLRGGPHRLGAYSCAHRLSSGPARRRLAASALHLRRNRAGLV